MLYLYNAYAGALSLTLEGDEHRYIFKVRRHKIDDILCLRNLEDTLLYRYRITAIDKRTTQLELQGNESKAVKASTSLHIGWCVIDPKNIEKILPSLNEIGVEKITFIYCSRSQKSFKIDFKRFEKILLNSSQQSGRSQMMILEVAKNLEDFLEQYPESKMLHFSENNFVDETPISTIVVGCEGGFSQSETALVKADNIVGFRTALVLKSESAVCALASKILL